MKVELTEKDLGIIITALVLYAHIPKITMDEDQKRAKELYELMKLKLKPLEEVSPP